jgi:hypothetical protein
MSEYGLRGTQTVGPDHGSGAAHGTAQPPPAAFVSPELLEPTTTPPAARRRASARRLVLTLDLRNTWQILVGAILVPLGVATILLGWSGAAHGRVPQEQIPYEISGGILGLGALIVGCFFFWAHWLYRIYDQAELHHQEDLNQQAAVNEELFYLLRQLGGGLSVPPGAVLGDVTGEHRAVPPPARPAGAAAAAGGATEVAGDSGLVVTSSGSNLHLRSCPVVARRLDSTRVVAASEVANYRPCRICDPLGSANGKGQATGDG